MLSEERGLYDAETVSMSVPFAIIEAPQARSPLARLLGPLAPLLLRGMHSTSRSARAASGPPALALAPSSQVAQFQFRRFRSVELCAVCNAAVAVSTSVLANNNQQRSCLLLIFLFLLDFRPSNSASIQCLLESKRAACLHVRRSRSNWY